MRKVAITGGHGFIGSAVVEELGSRGMQSFVLDRALGHDVMKPETWEREVSTCDAVIHLAGVLGTAELFDSPDHAIDVNMKGTVRVLEAAQKYQLAYVGITLPPVFPSVYTATKIGAIRLATAWHHAYGVPVSHVRAFNAFGPGQKHGEGHPQKIIPTFAHNAWRGQPLPVWGTVESSVLRPTTDSELGGEQTVDLVHVDDLARMLVDALNFGDDQVFDGGTGLGMSVNTVADLVKFFASSKSPIEYLPMRKGEIATNVVATGEGWDLLDWKPEFDPEQLRSSVRAYRGD